MDIPILFENDQFLVINKPYGVVVNRAQTTKTETIQDWMESRLSLIIRSHSGESETTPESLSGDAEMILGDSGQARMTIEEEFNSRSGVVHRLDKDTSGILVLAKNPQAFERLKNQFKERSTVKKYLALVHGKFEPPFGQINAPIERSPFNRMHYGVFPGGREAITDYRVISNFEFLCSKYSLVELTPHTGRTHQLRVHMKYVNHPIVSDPIYGGRKAIVQDLKFCPRLFLHATYLEIGDPETGEKRIFDAPLPQELEKVIANLISIP